MAKAEDSKYQPVAAGRTAVKTVPSGAMTSNGRKSPSFEGASGAVIALKTVLQADMSAPRAQLIGPRVWGAVPVKSATKSLRGDGDTDADRDRIVA